MSKTSVRRCMAGLILGVVLALILLNTLQTATRLYAGQPSEEQGELVVKPTSKNVSGSEAQEYGERGTGIVELEVESKGVLSAGLFVLEPVAIGLASGLIVYILARLLTR